MSVLVRYRFPYRSILASLTTLLVTSERASGSPSTSPPSSVTVPSTKLSKRGTKKHATLDSKNLAPSPAVVIPKSRSPARRQRYKQPKSLKAKKRGSGLDLRAHGIT